MKLPYSFNKSVIFTFFHSKSWIFLQIIFVFVIFTLSLQWKFIYQFSNKQFWHITNYKTLKLCKSKILTLTWLYKTTHRWCLFHKEWRVAHYIRISLSLDKPVFWLVGLPFWTPLHPHVNIWRILWRRCYRWGLRCYLWISNTKHRSSSIIKATSISYTN